MSIENVGEQWKKAVALGQQMTVEEKAREARWIQSSAQAKSEADKDKVNIRRHSLPDLTATEEILAVFDRLRSNHR